MDCHPDDNRDPDCDAKSLPGLVKPVLRIWVLTFVRMTVCVGCAGDKSARQVLPLDGEGGPRRSLGSDRVKRASVPPSTADHPLRLDAARRSTSPIEGEDLSGQLFSPQRGSKWGCFLTRAQSQPDPYIPCQPAGRIRFLRSRAAQPPLRGFTLELKKRIRRTPGKGFIAW
jgi:hypothetical protein